MALWLAKTEPCLAKPETAVVLQNGRWNGDEVYISSQPQRGGKPTIFNQTDHRHPDPAEAHVLQLEPQVLHPTAEPLAPLLRRPRLQDQALAPDAHEEHVLPLSWLGGNRGVGEAFEGPWMCITVFPSK